METFLLALFVSALFTIVVILFQIYTMLDKHFADVGTTSAKGSKKVPPNNEARTTTNKRSGNYKANNELPDWLRRHGSNR